MVHVHNSQYSDESVLWIVVVDSLDEVYTPVPMKRGLSLAISVSYMVSYAQDFDHTAAQDPKIPYRSSLVCSFDGTHTTM